MFAIALKDTNDLSTLFTTQNFFFDVWTSLVISYNDFKYYVIFVDHFTKYIWFYPLKQKS